MFITVHVLFCLCPSLWKVFNVEVRTLFHYFKRSYRMICLYLDTRFSVHKPYCMLSTHNEIALQKQWQLLMTNVLNHRSKHTTILILKFRYLTFFNIIHWNINKQKPNLQATFIQQSHIFAQKRVMSHWPWSHDF